MSVDLRLDGAALDRLLNQPSGPVGGHLRKVGARILVGARAQAGRDEGELVRKLYMKQGRRGGLQYVEVGSTAPHAYVHHEGTKPHMQKAPNGRLMRFNVGGQVVYARSVSHPGTRPNRYLTTPMRRAVGG